MSSLSLKKQRNVNSLLSTTLKLLKKTSHVACKIFFFFLFFSFKVEILSCGIYRFLFFIFFLLLMSVFKSSSVTKLWHFNLCNSSSCANVVSTSECLFLLRYMVPVSMATAQHSMSLFWELSTIYIKMTPNTP